jgi:DNA modification methylase
MNPAPAPAGPVPFFSSKGITLYCANSFEILPQLTAGSVHTLITDPPYGTTNLAWDATVNWPQLWPEIARVCKPSSPLVFFASGKFVFELITTNPRQYRYELIWEKNNPVGFLDANRRPLRSHENILIFSKIFKGSTYNPQMIEGKMHTVSKGGNRAKHYSMASRIMPGRKSNLYHPRSILRFKNRAGSKSLHPTQKPIELMKWLVLAYSHRSETILDPFAGSGSTLAAAAYHGRKAIGVEQDESYCETIAKRLEKGEA